MAWYTHTYKCGHTGRVNVLRKNEERRRKIEQIFMEICPQCKTAAFVAEGKCAAEEAKEKGLPPILGTERQVLWAESIRKDFFDWWHGTGSDINGIISEEIEAVF